MTGLELRSDHSVLGVGFVAYGVHTELQAVYRQIRAKFGLKTHLEAVKPNH